MPENNSDYTFSICMPVTNRGMTIFNALASVAKQSFRKFELIIVNCGSIDNSDSEIRRFFDSDIFFNNPFPYQFEQRDYIPQTVEDWNEPVKLAKGKYIAILEGDDQFLPDYLLTAYNYLTDNLNVGLYCTGNQSHQRSRKGWFSHRELLLFIYSMKEVPPPSEAIFIRTRHLTEIPFLYNDKDYEYAPEIDLYIQIAIDGYDAFFDDQQNVIRDKSFKDRSTWHYFCDQFSIIHKYSEKVGRRIENKTLSRFIGRVVGVSFATKRWAYIKDNTSHLVEEVGLFKILLVVCMLCFVVLKKYFGRLMGLRRKV